MEREQVLKALDRNFREKVRIVGENSNGRFSSVWTFLGGGDGFYFSARSLLNSFKVSLHANNHRGYLAFEKRYFGEKVADGRMTKPTRTVCEWALPQVGECGAMLAASVKLPADFMTGDAPEYVSQRKALVFGIEPGCALEIGVFLSMEGRETLEQKFIKIGHPLFEVANDKWLNVSLVVRSVGFDPVEIPLAQTVNATMQPLEDMTEQSDLNMLYWNKPEDGGTIQAVDIGGLSMRRNTS